ncbi:MAG TPA: hypothetical protein VK661_03435 [Planctomycetota bacterium]|nr:hypothetical protein [Planctomycetota bacterium]
MNLRRAALTVWILLQFAVIAVFLEVRGVELRYALAERGRRLQATALEHRSLRVEVETARSPEALARRARALQDAPPGPLVRTPGRRS